MCVIVYVCARDFCFIISKATLRSVSLNNKVLFSLKIYLLSFTCDFWEMLPRRLTSFVTTIQSFSFHRSRQNLCRYAPTCSQIQLNFRYSSYRSLANSELARYLSSVSARPHVGLHNSIRSKTLLTKRLETHFVVVT